MCKTYGQQALRCAPDAKPAPWKTLEFSSAVCYGERLHSPFGALSHKQCIILRAQVRTRSSLKLGVVDTSHHSTHWLLPPEGQWQRQRQQCQLCSTRTHHSPFNLTAHLRHPVCCAACCLSKRPPLAQSQLCSRPLRSSSRFFGRLCCAPNRRKPPTLICILPPNRPS